MPCCQRISQPQVFIRLSKDVGHLSSLRLGSQSREKWPKSDNDMFFFQSEQQKSEFVFRQQMSRVLRRFKACSKDALWWEPWYQKKIKNRQIQGTLVETIKSLYLDCYLIDKITTFLFQEVCLRFVTFFLFLLFCFVFNSIICFVLFSKQNLGHI